MTDTYDVIVVGASVAGCTAATLYARRGARVALLERRSDPQAFKVLCTHYIQPCATPTIIELGLTEELEAAGAVRNSADYWTPWGWIRPEGASETHTLPFGYNVRRETLDPMLRRLAANTEGVELLAGHTVDGLLRENGRVTGVEGVAPTGRFTLRGRLVVGADGKNSTVAQLAGARTKTMKNGRFSYFAQFRGLPRPAGNRTLSWFLDPDVAYQMPNDDDITVIACIPVKSRLPEFRDDLTGAFRRFVHALPGGPDLDQGELASKIMGTVDFPMLARQATGPGFALVGDAGLASDPIWGIGCGWAFQSAHWLVEASALAVRGAADLDRALVEYRRRRRLLDGYQSLIRGYATGRGFNPVERLMFSAAARDQQMARHFHVFGARLMSVPEFLAPSALARAAAVNVRHRVASTGWRTPVSAEGTAPR
ncbi:MAG TPA: NAD(P)/FAD-dependent oxidoreductase [Kineosporiaceae bacterium]|nr:NAD(P)/FAD-dependent oxidoreductase [Kineosporiaceae bacterium]